MYIKYGLLDFIAMDIKNTFEKYAETVGIKNFQLYKIISSISLIKESGIKHQFRTTLFSSSIDKNKIIQQVGEPVVFQEFVLPKKIEKNTSFSYSYNKNP